MTDEEFAAMVRDVFARLGVRAVARAVGMNYTSAQRWAEGRNFPHPAMRQAVRRRLAKLIRSE